MNPLIGIMVRTKPTHNKRDWLFIADQYTKLLKELDAESIIIPIVAQYNISLDIVDELDGVIIIGTYEEIEANSKLDNLERDICSKILNDSNMPVVGVQRGFQLINSISGGSEDFTDISVVEQGHKEITIVSKTALLDILQDSNIQVCSNTNKVIKELGRDLKINALDEDGVIEGIESIHDRFVMGIKWRLELVPPVDNNNSIYSKKIFTRFIRKSLNYKHLKNNRGK